MGRGWTAKMHAIKAVLPYLMVGSPSFSATRWPPAKSAMDHKSHCKDLITALNFKKGLN